MCLCIHECLIDYKLAYNCVCSYHNHKVRELTLTSTDVIVSLLVTNDVVVPLATFSTLQLV